MKRRFLSTFLLILVSASSVYAKSAFEYNEEAIEHLNSSRYEEAIFCFKSALRLAPKNRVIKSNLSQGYVGLAAEKFKKGLYKEANSLLKDALFYNPDNAHAYLILGQVYYREDKLEEAISNWEKAQELQPDIIGLKDQLQKAKKEREISSDFRVRESENFNVKYEGYERTDLGWEAVRILREAYRKVGQDFNFFPRDSITVIIYTEEQFKDIIDAHDWTMGIYDGKIRVRAGDFQKEKNFLRSILYHEYTHAVIHFLTGANIPFWLNEGLAQFEEIKAGDRSRNKEELKKAFLKNRLIPMARLSVRSFKDMSSDIDLTLAYQESLSIVEYLMDKYNFYQIRRILDELGEGKTIDEALKNKIYIDAGRLEERWLDWLKKRL